MMGTALYPLHNRVADVYSRFWSSETAAMMAMALLVGSVAGVGALFLIRLIQVLQGLFQQGQILLTQRTPVGAVLIPALGGLLAGPLIHYLAREAKGHGVPEVMQAVILRGGRIRPVVDRANPRRLVGMLRRGDIIRAYAHACVDEQTRLSHMERAQLFHRLDTTIVEVPLRDQDRAVGQTLRELGIPPECVIASIRRGGRVLIPRGKTRLEPGDVIIALVAEEEEETLKACLTNGVLLGT